jgi:hypothetical protein
MDTNQNLWRQHANPCLRVRVDGRYWAIAAPTTWDADESDEYGARVYYGAFPVRFAEVGFAWGDSLDQALTNAIAQLEGRLAILETQLQHSPAGGAGGTPAHAWSRASRARTRYAEEWQL